MLVDSLSEHEIAILKFQAIVSILQPLSALTANPPTHHYHLLIWSAHKIHYSSVQAMRREQPKKGALGMVWVCQDALAIASYMSV